MRLKTEDEDIIPNYIDYDINRPELFVECVRSIALYNPGLVNYIPLPKTLINSYCSSVLGNDINYSMFLIPILMKFRGQAIYLNESVRLHHSIRQVWAFRSMKNDVQFYNCDIDNPVIMIWNCERFPHRKLNDFVLKKASAEYLASMEWLKTETITT